MNKDRIAQLLKEPTRVAREDLAGLRELTERYPWFSGAHLLLALGENASGEVLFGETLRTTAAHLPSREVLFNEVERGKGKPGSEAASSPVEQVEARGPDPLPRSHDDLAQRILDQQILEAAAAGAYALQQRER